MGQRQKRLANTIVVLSLTSVGLNFILNLILNRAWIPWVPPSPVHRSSTHHKTLPPISLPACGRLVVFNDTRAVGFGSQLNGLLEAALFAQMKNASFVVVHPGPGWNYGCGGNKYFDCYFDMKFGACRTPIGSVATARVKPIPNISDLPGCTANLTTWLRNEKQQVGCLVYNADRYARTAELKRMFRERNMTLLEQLSQQRAVFHQTMKFNSQVQLWINRSVHNLGLLPSDRPGKQFIGVHIRRGDKMTEAEVKPTELYADVIKLLANDTGIYDLYVATDDYKEVANLEKLLRPHRFYMRSIAKNISSHGHSQGRVNYLKLADRMNLTRDLLVDLHVLSQATYFVGTHSSNVGRLVVTMSQQPMEHGISLDDRWNVGNMRWGRNDYCKLPGANHRVCDTILSMVSINTKWLQGCAASLSKAKPIPFRAHLYPGHHQRNLYRLADCLRMCACVPGHGNETMLTQYKSLACPPDPDHSTLEARGGMNMMVIEQLLTMRDGEPGFTRPDPDALVIHVRLGDVIEKTNATASRMLTNGALPLNGNTPGWIRSVHEYLSEIKKLNSTKVEIIGGSHIADSTKSRVYAGCLKRAIALSGYTVSMRVDEFSPDQDFYYVSHAKKLMVGTGGFSRLMGHMAQRHGGIII